MNNIISPIIRRCNHLLGEIEATYHEASLKFELSDSALKILYTICNFGESCLLGDIVRLSGLSKQTVNSAIRKMEDEGIVYLEAASAKTKKVCLTDSGKILVQKTALRLLQIEDEIFAAWPKENVQQYLELTERFLVALKKKVEQL